MTGNDWTSISNCEGISDLVDEFFSIEHVLLVVFLGGSIRLMDHEHKLAWAYSFLSNTKIDSQFSYQGFKFLKEVDYTCPHFATISISIINLFLYASESYQFSILSDVGFELSQQSLELAAYVSHFNFKVVSSICDEFVKKLFSIVQECMQSRIFV